MKFQRYTSLEQVHRKKFIDGIVMAGLSGGTWVATEKIHGANYGFHFDGTTMKRSKRSGFIGEDEVFFSDNRLTYEKDRVEDLYSIMLDFGILQESDKLSVFGEICGGHFAGAEKVNGAKRVQAVVDYHPDTLFLVFDLAVNDEYLPYQIMEDMINLSGLVLAPKIVEGTFKECIEHSNKFSSKVPAMYGLQAEGDNICEGIVIRPLLEERTLGNSRVIIKSKNSKFSEKGKSKPQVDVTVLDAIDLQNFEDLTAYLTDNRLSNVISKVGQPKQTEFGKIMGLLSQDAQADFLKDLGGTEMSDLSFEDVFGDNSKYCKKKFGKLTADFVRERWVDLLDA